MDTNKIREAAGKIWLNSTSHGTEEPYATLSKIILAELDSINPEPHVHTVYDAVGGGYICSGCEKRFSDAAVCRTEVEAIASKS